MNEKILNILVRTRAIRVYDKSRPISDEDWKLLLQVAENAPSSNGLEPWRILQIESQELRGKIAEFAPGMKNQLLTAPKFIFFLSLKIDKEYTEHLQKEIHGYSDQDFERWQMSFARLQNQLLQIDEIAWAERQAAIPLGQMLLAAGELGIDSCPMEGFDYAEVTDILVKVGALNPITEHLAVAASFGYRSESPKFPRTRRSLKEIVSII